MSEVADRIFELSERSSEAIEAALVKKQKREHIRELMETKCPGYCELALRIIVASTGEEDPFHHGWAWAEPVIVATANGPIALSIEAGSKSGDRHNRFYRIIASMGRDDGTVDKLTLYEFDNNYPASGNVIRDGSGAEVSEPCDVTCVGALLEDIAAAHGIDAKVDSVKA